MKNINWKVRIKNRTFWLTLIPALILVVQAGAAIFGYTIDFGDVGNKIAVFINAVFVLLTLLGIVNDPTTTGITDSTNALGYDRPNWR